MTDDEATLMYPCGCRVNGGCVTPCPLGASLWDALALTEGDAFALAVRRWNEHVGRHVRAGLAAG